MRNILIGHNTYMNMQCAYYTLMIIFKIKLVIMFIEYYSVLDVL